MNGQSKITRKDRPPKKVEEPKPLRSDFCGVQSSGPLRGGFFHFDNPRFGKLKTYEQQRKSRTHKFFDDGETEDEHQEGEVSSNSSQSFGIVNDECRNNERSDYTDGFGSELENSDDGDEEMDEQRLVEISKSILSLPLIKMRNLRAQLGPELFSKAMAMASSSPSSHPTSLIDTMGATCSNSGQQVHPSTSSSSCPFKKQAAQSSSRKRPREQSSKKSLRSGPSARPSSINGVDRPRNRHPIDPRFSDRYGGPFDPVRFRLDYGPILNDARSQELTELKRALRNAKRGLRCRNESDEEEQPIDRHNQAEAQAIGERRKQFDNRRREGVTSELALIHKLKQNIRRLENQERSARENQLFDDTKAELRSKNIERMCSGQAPLRISKKNLNKMYLEKKKGTRGSGASSNASMAVSAHNQLPKLRSGRGDGNQSTKTTTYR